MSASKKTDDKQNIVIVGGGYGGINVARALSKTVDASRYSLILINPRAYSILLPATLRMIVSDVDNIKDSAFLPYDKLFANGNGTFIHDSVTAIRPGKSARGELELRGGEKIAYDVLVLATGSVWDGPLAFPDDDNEVTQFIAHSRANIEQAEKIVLVGGGAVGIELAGEIKDIWPNKAITIVHREQALMNDTYPDRFRHQVRSALEERGVDVVLGDSIANGFIPEDGVIRQGKLTKASGTILSAEYAIKTWGARPNTSMIELSLGSNILTPNGTVKVKPTLQLQEHPNVFAIGDIVDWKEQKQAAKAKAQAFLTAKNIMTLLNDGAAPLVQYKGSYEIIVITNGKAGGFGYFGVLWGIVLGSWFAVMVKSKTLLLPIFRGMMGY